MRKPLLLLALGVCLAMGILGCGKSRKLSKAEGGETPDSGSKPQEVAKKDSLIRKCPESWYINAMPWVGEDSVRACEYLIIDDKRVELHQADTIWIKENCDITKSVLY